MKLDTREIPFDVQAASAIDAPNTYYDEIGRKLIHGASCIFPLSYYFLTREIMLWIMGGLLVASLITEICRHTVPAFRSFLHRRFGNLFRPAERFSLTGATYVFLASFFVILIFEKHVAIASLLVLSFSDSAASLVGRKVRSMRFGGKSLAGCAAFLISAFVIILLVLPDHWFAALVAACAGMLAESLTLQIRGAKVDDNLLIPFATAGALAGMLAI
ncbi:MAG: diacylglycerol/polyprenol kinase family protein [Phycisphaerae bacterium]